LSLLGLRLVQSQQPRPLRSITAFIIYASGAKAGTWGGAAATVTGFDKCVGFTGNDRHFLFSNSHCFDHVAKDFLLQSDSPVIMVGTADGVQAGELDLGGSPRVKSGNVGIGCYQRQSPRREQEYADRSVNSECDMECLKQSLIAEWLEQALDRTLFEQTRANSLTPVSGDEDDRNLAPAKLQFPLKVGPAHTRHGDVEDQASGSADAIGREELFRRRERARCKAELCHQIG
jgi:hypothetical protein